MLEAENGTQRDDEGKNLPTIRLEDLPDVMTVDEAARFLRVARSTAYDAVNRGEIPTFRVGRRIRVSKLALAAMVNGNKTA